MACCGGVGQLGELGMPCVGLAFEPVCLAAQFDKVMHTIYLQDQLLGPKYCLYNPLYVVHLIVTYYIAT